MYQRDYLLRLIEEYQKALLRIIGLKEKGKSEEAIREIYHAEKSFLPLKLEEIEHIETKNLIAELQKHHLTGELMEFLASLLIEKAEILFASPHGYDSSKSLYAKALIILQYLAIEDKKNYSLGRSMKIERLISMLSEDTKNETGR